MAGSLMDVSLPNVRMPLIDDQGCMTSPFYRYFQNANQNAGEGSAQIQSEITQIATALGSPDGTVQNIPDVNFDDFLLKNTTIQGRDAIRVDGSLALGLVNLSLLGDVETPPTLSFYGSMTGSRGWQQFTSNFANASGELDLSKPGNSNAGTLQAVTVDAYGRITGTRAATITGTANQIDVANGDGSAGAPTISLDAAVLNQLAALVGSPGLGYIDGLKMVWNSATSLSVTSGAAYIPSLGHVLQSPAMLTLSGLVLTASAWYHVYLYNNAGTPAIECVTTAPASPYNGTARAKTGDTSRRYMGSVLTDASGNVINFAHGSDGFVVWRTDTRNAPFRCVASGVAITATTVSLAGAIPMTANTAKLNCLDTDSSATLNLGNSLASAFPIHVVRPLTGSILSFPADSLQSMQYALNSTPSGGGAAFIDVLGYGLSR